MKCELSKFGLLLIVLVAVLIMAGCSEQEQASEPRQLPEKTESAPSAEPMKAPEPVTVRLHMTDAYGDDAFFEEIFSAPVRKKYPYISLDRVRAAQGETLASLAAANPLPDMFVNGVGPSIEYHDLGLATDLTEYVKKHNSDALTRYRDVVIKANYSLDGKELLGIPWNGNYNALYYNKDIFDKFGVPYPKDGMFWDEVIELTQRVSRSEDGIKYYGYDWASLHRISFPLSVTAIDGRNNVASVNTDSWRKVFELGYQLKKVPGNDAPPNSGGTNRFFRDRTVAMLGGVNHIYQYLLVDAAKDFNWDVVQYPSYRERPNTFGRVDVHNLQVSSVTKYKDEAFLVADLIGSAEIQTVLVRKHARFTPLLDPGGSIMKQFADDIPELKDKNVKSLFKSDYAPFNINHKLESAAFNIVTRKFNETVTQGKDINTALREAEEEINKLPLRD